MEHRKPGRKSKGPIVRENFKVPEALADAIRDYAVRHGMTKTDLVCEAVAARIGVPYRPETRLSVVLDDDAAGSDPAGLHPDTRAAVDRACEHLAVSRLSFVEAALQMALTRPDELVQALGPARPSVSAPQQEVSVARSA